MTNDLATRNDAPRPALRTGGQVAALVPQSLEEAFRVANAIAASGLAPRGLDKPEQVLVAIMAGAELGLAPFQSLQSIAVVNGRPTLWGDGLMAIARSQGITAKEWIDGEGDARTAFCEVTRPDSGEVIRRSFTIDQAKKAGLWGKQGPWQQYPERMLQMRARAWALRDGCADFLRGFQVREEVEDFSGPIRDVTPVAPLQERLAARRAAEPAAEGFTPTHAEIIEPEGAESEPAQQDDAASQEGAASEEPELFTSGVDDSGSQEPAADPQSDGAVEGQDDASSAAQSEGEGLPLDTLESYSKTLWRAGSEKSLKDIAKVFWDAKGGFPQAGKAREQALAINAIHAKRARGETVGPEAQQQLDAITKPEGVGQ